MNPVPEKYRIFFLSKTIKICSFGIEKLNEVLFYLDTKWLNLCLANKQTFKVATSCISFIINLNSF